MKTVRSRGFTVLEAVVASAAMGVVLLAAMSLIVLSARAGPEAAAQADAIRDARGFGSLNDDLSVATAVMGLTATEIKVEVPDRTGDRVADVVRYWWPGAGSGLYREVNNSGAAALTGPWTSLSLAGTWASRSVTVLGASTLGSASQRLAAFGLPESGQSTHVVTNGTPLALTVMPRLATAATHWKVDTLTVSVKSITGASGTWSATLRVDALLLPFASPASAVCTGYTSQRRGADTLLTFTFSGAPEIAVTQTATFDIRTSSGTASATLYGVDSGVGDSRQWLHAGAGAVVTLATEKTDASIEHLVCGWVRLPVESVSSASRLTSVGVTATGASGGTVGFVAGAIGEPHNP